MKTTKEERAAIRERATKSLAIWQNRECLFKIEAQDFLKLLDDIDELQAQKAELLAALQRMVNDRPASKLLDCFEDATQASRAVIAKNESESQ